MFDIDMNDPWAQMYAKLPHYEKKNGEWFYVHYGGEVVSKVSKEKAEMLEEEQQMWNEKWEELSKELENL